MNILKPDKITKIQEIISELDIQIYRFKEKGDEHSVQLCSDVRSDYIEDLKKIKLSS